MERIGTVVCSDVRTILSKFYLDFICVCVCVRACVRACVCRGLRACFKYASRYANIVEIVLVNLSVQMRPIVQHNATF